MSSLSDKEFYQLSISINKALNAMEAPLKMKHARSAIIMTHRTKEAKSFWTLVMKQPLMENRFTAWKFCHLLHKVSREGHGSTLKYSQTHKKMILEMGKLWGHLHDGVGNCIQAYSKLIVTKLDFHEKNLLFPGSLMIDFREIEKFASDDINVYFELCVEIFDYLDDIIDMQSQVFVSINTYRMSSMTPQGQCRLAPLITLIQDSNPLYDLCVRVMFKLHNKLPNDILAGHRDRFRELFRKLKHFYDNVRPLQYFADLIQVPHLPEAAPNFTSMVDFGSYIPPVVYVQPDPELVIDNLVDMSILQEEPSHLNDELIVLQNNIKDKDSAIQELKNEVIITREAYNSMETNYKTELLKLQNTLSDINEELVFSKEMCTNIQSLKDDLELQLANTPTMLQKSAEDEEKVKISQEKFTKLKAMYNQIRDEHINLLRQQSDVNKLLSKEKMACAEYALESEQLKIKYNNLEEEVKIKSSKCSDLETKYQEITNRYDLILTDYYELKREHEKLNANKCAEDEQVAKQLLELKINVEELDFYKSKTTELETSIKQANEIFRMKNDEYEVLKDKYNSFCEHKSVYITELESAHVKELKEKYIENNELQQRLSSVESQLWEKKAISSRLSDEKLLIERELQDSFQQNTDLEKKLKTTLIQLESIHSDSRNNEDKYESLIFSLLQCVFKAIENTCSSKLHSSNQKSFEKSYNSLDEMDKLLNDVSFAYCKFSEDKNSVERLAQQSILLGYNFIILHEQCFIISNNTTDIDKGQDICNKVNILCDAFQRLFILLQKAGAVEEIGRSINIIKLNLADIKQLITDLMKESNTNLDLGDVVENELKEMEKAIEEAAETFVQMLSKARSKDNGIKLEVNEKILDACTALMECIKILIQKSKNLQDEIVSTGQGTVSAKEFYKRNSQWTEGLISASKSVAKGANLLMDAANKAVTTESNSNLEIIVAAQEIAACTAQLVIASKVKAVRNSQRLTDLTKASRNVSQATGEVVATVKDCNQYLEQPQEIDLSTLTASQAKAMEIEIHVKVLGLEQSLQLERGKLLSFRKKYYQNTED